MSKEKMVAIGDIHGCVESLKALIKKLETYQDRTIVFIGDYIDRGPRSKEVVDYLLDLREKIDCVFLRGNHEQMLLDTVEQDERRDIWMRNGGDATLRSYGEEGDPPELPEEHLQFFADTRMYYESEHYFFVHAGLPSDLTIEECKNGDFDIKKVMWERSHLNAFETSWEKKVIFGHTPRPRPLKKQQMIGIDTGCVYDRVGYGKLTAVRLPEEEFIQQLCLDQ